MRKHILPLTYAPKIPAVLDGTCTQTIRAGRRVQACDLVMFHGWEGKPYHSKLSFRTPYWKVEMAWPIVIHITGLSSTPTSIIHEWNCRGCTDLAERDGIVPSNGQELGRVLHSMHTIPDTGLPAQIIRWDPKAVKEMQGAA